MRALDLWLTVLALAGTAAGGGALLARLRPAEIPPAKAERPAAASRHEADGNVAASTSRAPVARRSWREELGGAGDDAEAGSLRPRGEVIGDPVARRAAHAAEPPDEILADDGSDTAGTEDGEETNAPRSATLSSPTASRGGGSAGPAGPVSASSHASRSGATSGPGDSGATLAGYATAASATAGGAPVGPSVPTTPPEGAGGGSPGGETPEEATPTPDEPTPDATEQTPPPRENPPVSRGAATVRLEPALRLLSVGQQVAVHIVVEGAEDAASIPFRVIFDPAVLHFDQAQQGPFLGRDGSAVAFMAGPDQDGGQVIVGLSRLGEVEGLSGSGDLCTLTFTAVGPGTTGLRFDDAKIRTADGDLAPANFVPSSLQVRSAEE